MGQRLFLLDVPENRPIVAAARELSGVEVGAVGPYLVVEADHPITIDRRTTGARHAVWYSCVAGLDGWRIAQWDKDVLRTECR